MSDPLDRFRPAPVRPFAGNTIKLGDVEVPVFSYDLTYKEQLAYYGAAVLLLAAKLRKERSNA